MSTSCTVYSPILDFSVTDIVATALPGWRMELQGTKNHWLQARFSDGELWLELNSLERVKPGDQFSKIILGTANFIRINNSIAELEKKEMNRFLGAIHWLVGVVSSGELAPGDVRWNAVNAVARHLQGRIFTGSALVLPA